ncbi:Glycosyltransferase [Rhynchospora pubera]|uniref:Glycosyltransferase n=1 Tax=Rhynchospora pubera TaxID=906938 RepID=A0AAV8GK08_9POAL|nr:Glycosyltransferase [Rhynchospora pubera]
MASSDNLPINSNHANTKKWRVFVLPYFARGHLIPMTDFARLLSASHPDIEPTMVVTPGNTSFITSSLGKSNGSTQQPVQILTYSFPSIGLKSNHETVGIGTSTESSTIDQAFRMVRAGQEQFLGQHKPDAVIVDAKFPWIATTAANLGIPCLFFLTTGVFPLVVCRYLSKMRAKLSLHDYVTVSGLPGPEIRMPALELPGLVLPEEENYARYVENTILKSWLNAFGIVVNTFHGLESEYCNHFEKTHAKRAYFVGPVSLSCKKDQDSILGRGGKGNTDCLGWLDNKEERSVIFVSFGSQCYFKPAQLHELAIGLEESGQKFLWVIRGDNESEWMPKGWEERIGDRGLVVRGWVPQVAILAHAATGAFMTHCGWNSLLESTAAGVPMLTWPFAAEEFISEKLLVDMVGCATRVWEGGKRSTRETESELVPRTVIARAVSRFMEPGGEYSSVHCKAREIGTVARSAMADGGSSTSDLSRLINDLINAMQNKTCS